MLLILAYTTDARIEATFSTAAQADVDPPAHTPRTAFGDA
jgi:hypothetical protein